MHKLMHTHTHTHTHMQRSFQVHKFLVTTKVHARLRGTHRGAAQICSGRLYNQANCNVLMYKEDTWGTGGGEGGRGGLGRRGERRRIVEGR